ncbi:type I-E CRISPR-associated protein Cas5/CasD [Streptomyces sp. NPDC058045]|uniref:type I-E CRISPR-associated protein Cas5/CasD n=1 Tax=Streptomyces sp. NPDC058045 TaxID=3346311 RepID=UPI0036EE66DC
MESAKKKGEPEPPPESSYLMFLSSRQLDGLARLAVEGADDITAYLKIKENKNKAREIADTRHSVDIALFGRMVADSADFNVDAAAQVAHAISVHQVENESDYFTAVDDQNEKAEESGAGMIGTVDFNSATLYRFARRTTERAPTKSGVIGLLAAAQGRDRTADISDLAALTFAVRLDQPGTRVRDFHTAAHADTGKSMPVSHRFYLSDAVFVAAVEGDEDLIGALHTAVRAPTFLPFLGRRSCPPSRPIDLGVHHGGLWRALGAEPWQASAWFQRRRARERRIELEVVAGLAPGAGPGDPIRDQPLSFDRRHRRYGLREVYSGAVTVTNPLSTSRRTFQPPKHEPMGILED